MSHDDFDPPEVGRGGNDDDPPDGFDSAHFLFEEMTDGDWRKLLRDLGRFAASRVRQFRWVVPPAPEDVVLECLNKLLLKPSMWKPERRRDDLERREALKRFLFQMIWRHLQKLRELKYEDWRIDNQDETGRDRLDQVPKRQRSPEERLEDERRREKILEIERFLEKRGYGETFHLRYRCEMKAREIADYLQWEVEKVYAALQRMRELIRRHFGTDPEIDDLLGAT